MRDPVVYSVAQLLTALVGIADQPDHLGDSCVVAASACRPAVAFVMGMDSACHLTAVSPFVETLGALVVFEKSIATIAQMCEVRHRAQNHSRTLSSNCHLARRDSVCRNAVKPCRDSCSLEQRLRTACSPPINSSTLDCLIEVPCLDHVRLLNESRSLCYGFVVIVQVVGSGEGGSGETCLVLRVACCNATTRETDWE